MSSHEPEPRYKLNLIVKGDKDKFISWLRSHRNETITEHLIQRAMDEL